MHRANPNGLSDSLQEREVDMHIEPLRLLSGEAAGDILEPFPHRIEMIEPLLEPEVGQVVRADLVAQEHGELLVLLDEGILAVGAEDMVTRFDLLHDIGQFAFEFACYSDAEDLADLVRRQPPEPQFAAALEDLVNGEMTLEDEVAAVLDLGDGVEA